MINAGESTEPRPTPASLGYHMPAEWAPHVATWLSWPHRQATWPGNFAPIPELYAKLIRTLAEFEPVNVLAGGGPFEQARQMLRGVANVTIHDFATNDVWLRDCGPIFLVGPSLQPPALVDWGYNAYGGKYLPCDLDDALPQKIAAMLGQICFQPGVIMEGGAIDVDGEGTLLTTEACLLNPNRNPGLAREQIEDILKANLGVRKILWLGGGIVGDDTDGHVDELARFVAPGTVVAAVERDKHDVNYTPLADNLQRLQSMTDADGRKIEIVELPLPGPVHFNGARLPASYCNFYIGNGVVLVPQFGDPADGAALEILRDLFPGRTIIGLPAQDLVLGRGAFHCITQQQPAQAVG